MISHNLYVKEFPLTRGMNISVWFRYSKRSSIFATPVDFRPRLTSCYAIDIHGTSFGRNYIPRRSYRNNVRRHYNIYEANLQKIRIKCQPIDWKNSSKLLNNIVHLYLQRVLDDKTSHTIQKIRSQAQSYARYETNSSQKE